MEPEHSRYRLARRLGRGSYSTVYLARDLCTGGPVALKCMERDKLCGNSFLEQEVLHHMLLRHPHIVPLHELFLTEQHLVMALQHAPGGDLARLLPPGVGLPEEQARWIFKQLAFALHYTHLMGVAHRDIKLQNILVVDSSQSPIVQLADFGFSVLCDASGFTPFDGPVGTPAYLSPEVLTAVKAEPYNAQAHDVWSCGVVLALLLTGTSPFQRPTDAKLDKRAAVSALLQRVQQADYVIPERLSEECQDLLRRMLAADPGDRLTAPDLLLHPWCANHGIPASSMLRCNADYLASSLAMRPSPLVVREVRSIFREACKAPTCTPKEMAGCDSCDSHATAVGGRQYAALSSAPSSCLTTT